MIKLATKEDINDIVKLGNKLYHNFESIYFLDQYLCDDRYIILVEKNHSISGFMLVYKNIDYYELQVIVVSEMHRRKGVATRLMTYFIDNFCKHQDSILLEVATNNINAVNLYKNFNFEIIHTRKKYYQDIDAYIMKKVIN